MRKYFFNLLSAVFILAYFAAVNAGAEAEETALIKVETAECVSGETVDVGIDVYGNPGVIAMGIGISYDVECLELTGADDGKLYKGASFTPSGDLKQIPFRIMWEDALTLSDHTDNGRLAVLHFKILDNAKEGMSEIKVSADEKNTFDIDFKDVHFDVLDGGVNIKKSADGQEMTAAEKTENKTDENTDTGSSAATALNSAEAEYFMPVDKICEMVSDDFEKKTGEKPESAETAILPDGKLKIVLKNKIGSVIDTYSVDPVTGKGSDSNGNNIDISAEKDVFRAKNIIIGAFIAAAVILVSVSVTVMKKRGSGGKQDEN